MTSEVYIENYRLDISSDLSSLLTFEIDNIRQFADRSTTWSKTIVLPGTSNNNKLFGHIFQIGQANYYDPAQSNVGYNFNASKSADCIIFQNQIQTFIGVIRLLQINIYKGRTEYEVAVFGKLAQLNVSLSAGKLEDLDFSVYNHVYNTANIIASWDNAPGTGYYYPLADYGTYSTAKHNWDIRTFRPALYAREYIDKMFAAAGFRWQSDLMDAPRFKQLVIPHNRKTLTVNTSNLLTASRSTDQTVIGFGFASVGLISFPVYSTTVFTPGGGSPPTFFTYNAADTINVLISGTLNYRWSDTGNGMVIKIYKNATVIATKTLFNTGGSTQSGAWNFSVNVSVATTDQITFEVSVTSSATPYTFVANTISFTTVSAGDIPVPIAIGNTVVINDILPKNIRQLDFLVGLVKLFNLYVYEDRFDSSLIYIKPYVDFYSTDQSNAIDWTYKLNRDKIITIKPMSELNARKYEFKYKPDSDYYNDLYRKRYNEGYGDYVFDSLYEFAEQTKSFEIIFSATPLVGYSGQVKVYSTIFKRTGTDAAPVEERTDSNIRILQTKKILGVTSWNILDGATVLASTVNYGYAGHLNNPDAPADDLNFGALRELFFILSLGNLTVTQFNLYWSAYMAEITDKDSKLLTAWFYLTPLDINQLDFSKYVWIDSVLYRLNKISDYNASKPMDTLVELFKVGYTNYTESGGGTTPEVTYYLLWNDTDQIMLHEDTDQKIKFA